MTKPNIDVPVVILCGGLGTRLREETEFKPKPMVSIGGRPILWHIMKTYAHYGFTRFILCLGYKGEVIRDYFYHYRILNNDFTIELGDNPHINIHSRTDEDGWSVTLADTGLDSLKGSRIKRIEKYINSDTFMVTYGDGVADIQIRKLLKFHLAHKKMVTVSGVHKTSQFGELMVEGDRVTSFMEKPTSGDHFVSGGFFVFQREIFNYLQADKECDLEIGVLEAIAKKKEMMMYKHNGFWACMDTQRDMEYLNRLWNKHQATWKVWV